MCYSGKFYEFKDAEAMHEWRLNTLHEEKTRPKDEKLPGAKEDVIDSIKETDEILKNIESPTLLDFFAEQVAEKVANKIEVCIMFHKNRIFIGPFLICTINIDVP